MTTACQYDTLMKTFQLSFGTDIERESVEWIYMKLQGQYILVSETQPISSHQFSLMGCSEYFNKANYIDFIISFLLKQHIISEEFLSVVNSRYLAEPP